MSGAQLTAPARRLSALKAAAAWKPGVLMERIWEGPRLNVDLVLQENEAGKPDPSWKPGLHVRRYK